MFFFNPSSLIIDPNRLFKMKIYPPIFRLSLFVYLFVTFGLAISQDMEVIRVIDNKIVGNMGSEEGITRNQQYIIYRILATGPTVIGFATVSEVKKSLSVLSLVQNETGLTVVIGDILIRNDDHHTELVSESPKHKNLLEENASSPFKGRIGIRGGIGTDTAGGLVGCGSLSYLVPTYPNPLEIGFLVLSASIEKKTDNSHTYVARTDILASGLYINYLYNYRYSPKGLFLVLGTGLVFVDIMWEKSSDTDTSLGKLLPDGGSTQSDEGGRMGILFQFGLGYKFSNSVNMRLEVPVFYINDPPGDASSIATIFVLSLDVRFK